MKKLFSLLAICMFVGVNAQDDSNLIKNGMYIESFAGIATIDYSEGNTGFGLKLGNVWYFDSSDLWRPGFKTIWFRGAAYFGDNGSIVQGSVLNVGFANIIKFKQNLGMEANINFGYNVVYSENDYAGGHDFTGGGFMINPEIKFRYNVLAIGLDIVFSNVTDYTDENYYNHGNINSNDPLPHYYNEGIAPKISFTAINLTIGAKF